MRSSSSFSLCVFFTLVCFSLGQDDYAEVAPMDKSELVSLFSTIQGFVGSWWNGSDLYPDPCGWTPIQGVMCDIFDGLWYVTAISIGSTHDNSLACGQHVEFSPHLFNLKHLASLTFYNCFTKQITISSLSWNKLSNTLKTLEFRSNQGLIGTIPPAFGELWELESLVLVENGFAGEIPRNVGNLRRLKRLNLAGNKLNGTIPESVGQCSELLILDLSRNLLSGTLPVGLGMLRSLLKLDLSYNELNGTLLQEFVSLKNLTLLDLSNNRLSGGLVQSLQSMDSLQELVLSNNPLNGELRFMEWPKMASQLVILDLSNMGLSGPIPESLSELKRLRFLGLNDNNLSGSLTPKLAALPSLTGFYIHGNNLTGDLTFSGKFYLKMGRRFGAYGNPNLCYSAQRGLSVRVAPFGVKPCR
ncbi:unnamed protein product [Rhodiola kirilowii]